MSDKYEYSNYLKRRSKLAVLYRVKWLYPRIVSLVGDSFLDVGCGIGDMLAFHRGALGVDVNPYNVSFCKSRGLQAALMPFDQIPFESNSFDAVLLDNVLEHITDPKNLIEEIKRVLRPDGTLVIGVPGLKGQSSDLDHKIFYNEASLETLAERSGFRVNKYMYAPLFRSDFLSRVLTQYCIYTQWQKID